MSSSRSDKDGGAAEPVFAAETRRSGAREILLMAWPIILGNLSYTFMDFADRWMIAQLGTEALAAIGSAGLWSYIMCTFILGVVATVSTFISQSIGRGEKEHCARYVWQGIYLSMFAGALALALWPLSGPLFNAMGHSQAVTGLELTYFQIRLLGYIPMAWTIALAVFFQAIDRAAIPMRVAFVAIIVNVALNYLLIFGAFGFPEMGIAGAAVGTIIAQWVQVILLQWIYLRDEFHKEYGTRSAWRFDPVRTRELVRFGAPSSVGGLFSIVAWGVFFSFIVGRFGDAALAGSNSALTFMHFSVMPVFALSQAISIIAGRWVGRGNIALAKARTHMTIYISVAYMASTGAVFAFYGDRLIAFVLTDDPEVIRYGHAFLMLAAISRFFNATNIISAGALRGVGDMHWLMWNSLLCCWGLFMPLAYLIAFPLGGGAIGAWTAATLFHVVWCATVFRRFQSEAWQDIRIFEADSPPGEDATTRWPGTVPVTEEGE